MNRKQPPPLDLPAHLLPEKGEPVGGDTLLCVLALAGLEGKWVHLSADSQRRTVGYPVFGKNKIRSRFDKTRGYVVDVAHQIAFGLDFESGTFTLAEVTAAAKAKKKLPIG